jgi:hypothetical protein
MLPVLGPLLATLSSIASAHFMLITGKSTLKTYISPPSDPSEAKPTASLTAALTLFLVIGLLQILPSFVFDVQYHLTAMWTVILPGFLTTRLPMGKRETVAEFVAKGFLTPAYQALKEALPEVSDILTLSVLTWQGLVKPGKGPQMAEVSLQD